MIPPSFRFGNFTFLLIWDRMVAMQPTTGYKEALAYIYSLTDYEKQGFAAYAAENYDLGRVRHLLALLDEPERAFGSVHIAGSKGKGSTAAMAESMLRAAGYRTGLYTSPHLHTFRERIRLDGALISEAEVVRLVQQVRPLADQISGITTFEVMTAMALAWFAQNEAEWVVLEVGLGGRLDATNVVMPAVAVITSISLDHIAILGDTLAKIAAEKAGIVKPGVPVVSAPQPAEALQVIEETCAHREAPLTLVGRDWNWERLEPEPGSGPTPLEGQWFRIQGGGRGPVVDRGAQVLERLWIPLLGEYQLSNATTAVAALRQIPEIQRLSEAAIREGLRSVYWPGRLEILGRQPLVVVDSAHNGDSAKKLMAALHTYLRFDRLIVVLGASADHVTPELLTAFLAGADRAIVTRSRHPRAAQPSWIQEGAAALGFEVETSEDVPQALGRALDKATAADLVLCTGSVFVAAEARAAWFALQGLPLPLVDPT
jgi:dihydrofolate synthase/folylpolyglutamate synthase